MQTSQVSNAANMLSAPAPGKQPDANASGESFGQVLSREVADRQRSTETPKGQAPENANKQPASTGSKRTDAKPSNETKSTRNADKADETSDTNAQASADMLALVASLTQTVAPVADAGDTKAAMQDAVIDPALDAATPAAAASDQATASILNSIQSADPGNGRKPGAASAEIGKSDAKAKPDLGPITAGKAEVANATKTADMSPKGQEVAVAVTGQPVPEFAANMKEALSSPPATMAPVQHAAFQAIQAAVPHTADKLTPAVGSPAWDQALGQKVIWMVAGEQQSASLTLNPPDLGPLQVVLSVTNSHANASFTAAQPEVRQALEAAMPRLREMLGDAGIQLGQATVNSGSPNSQNTPDQQSSQGRHGFEQADNRPETPLHVSRVQPTVSGVGLVDTFV